MNDTVETIMANGRLVLRALERAKAMHPRASYFTMTVSPVFIEDNGPQPGDLYEIPTAEIHQ